MLVPAAGAGTRLGGQRKQFRLLGGKPLLVQTLRVFDRHPLVDHLVVAAPASAPDELEALLAAEAFSRPCTVVPGGETRQASVGAALAAVPAGTGVVLVHDAVRPFVPEADVTAVVEAVRAHGAAALAVPVSDTLRGGEAGWFGATVPREGLYRMQTPQGFRRDWFEAAHRAARAEARQATDDVDLVRAIGHPVRIVEATGLNLKVTTAADWELARTLWRLRRS